MKLPKIPVNKFSIGTAAVGLLGGMIITASAATGTHVLDLGKKADSTTPDTSQSQQTASTSSDTAASGSAASDQSVTDPANPSSTGANTTTGVGQNSTPATTNSPSTADPIVPPPTVTDISLEYRDSATPGYQDGICHYGFSDGSTKDKYIGKRPVPDAHQQIDMECPAW